MSYLAIEKTASYKTPFANVGQTAIMRVENKSYIPKMFYNPLESISNYFVKIDSPLIKMSYTGGAIKKVSPTYPFISGFTSSKDLASQVYAAAKYNELVERPFPLSLIDTIRWGNIVWEFVFNDKPKIWPLHHIGRSNSYVQHTGLAHYMSPDDTISLTTGIIDQTVPDQFEIIIHEFRHRAQSHFGKSFSHYEILISKGLVSLDTYRDIVRTVEALYPPSNWNTEIEAYIIGHLASRIPEIVLLGIDPSLIQKLIFIDDNNAREVTDAWQKLFIKQLPASTNTICEKKSDI